MNNFKNWLSFNESVTIKEIDPESDWQTAAKIDELAHESGIRISRNKNIYIAAFDERKQLVGGIAASLDRDSELSEEENQDVGVLSFDVVVSPKASPTDMIGIRLIKEAEKLKDFFSDSFDKIIIRNEVINGKLAKVMQHPKMGYSPKFGEYDKKYNKNLYKY